MASKLQATITSNTTYYQIYFYYQITPQSYSSGYGKSKVEFDFIVEELADRRFKTNMFSGKSLSVNGTSYPFSTTQVNGYALNTDDGINKGQYSFFTNSKVDTSSSSYTFPKSFTITHTQAGAGSAFSVSLSAVNAPCDGYGPGKVSISATVPASAFTTLPYKYTITYNKGSYGTGTNFTAQKLYGSSKTLSGTAFTRSGYTQTGWSTSSNGGTKSYDLNASYTSNSNITLYPYWTATSSSLKISYDFYGSSGITQNSASGYGLSTEGYQRIHKNGSEFSTSIAKSGATHRVIHPYEFGIEKPGYVFNDANGYNSAITRPVIAGNTYSASDLASSSSSYVWLSAADSNWEQGYKITINPNGGSMQYDKWGSIDSNTHSYSFIQTDWLPISLSNSTIGYYSGYNEQGYFGRGTYVPGLPTRSGRIFKGWSLSSGNTPTIYSLNNHGDSVNVYIAYKDHQDITATAIWDYPLSVNQSYNVTISNAGSGVYFTTDVIPTTKTYYFNSKGTLDSQIKVYNENGTTLIDDDDDSGEGNNFKLALTLEAGKRYRVFVRLYSSGTGTFQIFFGEGFTLSYNSNGVTSTMPASETMEYGLDHTISSTTPTFTGRVFSHWNTEPDGTGVSADPGDIIQWPTSSLTLYAIWESNYTITFEKNTTDSVSNMPGTYNSSTGKYTATKVHGVDYQIPSKVPTRTGYTFVGWGASSSATTYVNGPTGMTNPFIGGTYAGTYTQDADYTYYAIWSLNPNTNYTTSTLSAGGYQEYLFLPSTTKDYSFFTRTGTASNKLDTKLFLYNSSGTLLTENDDDSSGELNTSEDFHPDNNYNSLIRTSLTAKTMYKIRVAWLNTSYSGAIPFTLATSHTITLDPQGGSVSTPSLTGWFGREYSDCGLSTSMFSRAGYNLTGLATNLNDFAGTEITPEITRISTSSNHTVYAGWASKSFIITLNNQSATSAGTASVALLYNQYWYSTTTSEQITKITKPTRTGYTFGGYYTETNGSGVQIINSSGNFISGKLTYTTADDTLYAKWIPNTYTVNFNANGGSVSPTSTTVTYASTYGTLPTPTWAGHTFNGWYTSSSGGTRIYSTSTVTITSTQTLYAHWTPWRVTKFDINHSSINPNLIAMNSSQNFTNLGVSFNYDVTTGIITINGTRNSTEAEVQFGNFLCRLTNGVSYTISAEYISGSVSGGCFVAEFDVADGQGRFKCDIQNASVYSTGQASINNETIRLWAWTNTSIASHITFNNYKIRLKVEQASSKTDWSPEAKELAQGTTYGTLAAPVREGYNFLGWYTSAGTQITSSSTVPTSDSTVYAHWDPTGLVRIYYDGEWKYAVPYIYTTNGWKRAMSYTHNGTAWKQGTNLGQNLTEV